MLRIFNDFEIKRCIEAYNIYDCYTIILFFNSKIFAYEYGPKSFQTANNSIVCFACKLPSTGTNSNARMNGIFGSQIDGHDCCTIGVVVPKKHAAYLGFFSVDGDTNSYMDMMTKQS